MKWNPGDYVRAPHTSIKGAVIKQDENNLVEILALSTGDATRFFALSPSLVTWAPTIEIESSIATWPTILLDGVEVGRINVSTGVAETRSDEVIPDPPGMTWAVASPPTVGPTKAEESQAEENSLRALVRTLVLGNALTDEQETLLDDVMEN